MRLFYFYLFGQLQSVTVTSHQHEPNNPVQNTESPPFMCETSFNVDTDFLFNFKFLIPFFFMSIILMD